MATQTDQYDSPWKEAIEEYFPECMAFFFPQIHADIDWVRGYEFLDKELSKVVRQALVTEQHVDKLARVYRKSGAETWVLVHIDVQSQHEANFSTRMYQYNYRLFDRYNKPVVTLVIYGDESGHWQPKTYQRKLWGFEMKMTFPSVKLLHYDLDELIQHPNPFAVVVLAHRYTKATKNNPNQRYTFKWRLTRLLYERGYNKNQILSLFRYIDWMMALPDFLEKKLDTAILDYEEAQNMTFNIRERYGYQRGIQEGIEQGLVKGLEQGKVEARREALIDILMIRFGPLPDPLVQTLNQVDQLPRIETLYKKALAVENLALFEQFVADQ